MIQLTEDSLSSHWRRVFALADMIIFTIVLSLSLTLQCNFVQFTKPLFNLNVLSHSYAFWGVVIYLTGYFSYAIPMRLKRQNFYHYFQNNSIFYNLFYYSKAIIIVVIPPALLLSLVEFSTLSWQNIVTAFILLLFVLLLKNILLAMTLLHYTRKAKERVLLLGSEQSNQYCQQHIPQSYLFYWQLVNDDMKMLPTNITQLQKILEKYMVSKVVFTESIEQHSWYPEALQLCQSQGISSWLASAKSIDYGKKNYFEMVGNIPMLQMHVHEEYNRHYMFKHMLDIVGASILILLSLPFWLFAMIGIKLTSKGPVFFKQKRVGKFGEIFWIYKFRTMHMHAEQELDKVKQGSGNDMAGPTFKLERDPRIFRFGALLRKTSIDELPQFINVLKGEMSLVGPRPLPDYEVAQFEKPLYRRRLSVKPGITCTWQIEGRSNITNFEDWVQKDLNYIDNWSFYRDIIILLKTIPAVLLQRGAK